MDRAQIAGLGDVGIGALFGLYDYRFEVLAMMEHAAHLDRCFGTGPHTISVPRLQPAAEAPDAINPPAPVSDDDFKKLVAVIRCAVPYTGMILSTREPRSLRKELLEMGISQMSAGSSTEMRGYTHDDNEDQIAGQFSLQDTRGLSEVVTQLCRDGYCPSFCTACYRVGRTGEAFMKLAKTGKIHSFCHPNALLTLQEYVEDYAPEDNVGELQRRIAEETGTLPSNVQGALAKRMTRIRNGERDLFW